MPQHLTGEDATTWILTPQPAPESARSTSRVQPGPTSPTSPPPAESYLPPSPVPAPYYPPPSPAQYQPPTPVGSAHISLGDWLSGGWQVYRENWSVMSVATLVAFLLSLCTLGVLAGPLLMGLFRMAFATMRGVRPVMGDLFNWRGRFLQSFLTALIYGAIYAGLGGIGNNNAFFALLSAAATPMLSVMLSFTMSLILERDVDVLDAINQVTKLVFSRDAFMWWVVGLVFAAITGGGFIACGIGILVTLPWMVSASAVAYKDVFGDDPNRTLH
ncbi:MAG TPA: hypothetical protein VLM38_06350 [Blastocatellia bacterium]|nr:hypothetical protein [Blastocatellia bacterium]